MSKKALIILIVCLAVIFLAAAATFVITQYYIPYQNALSSMPPQSQVILQEQPDGRIQVTWPAGENVDQYLFEIEDPHAGSVLYSCYISGQTTHVIDALPDNRLRTIRITPVAGYQVPFEESQRMRQGEPIIEITDCFGTPDIKDISWQPNPNTDQVAVSLTMSDKAVGRMYALDEYGTPSLSATLSGGKIVLSFGEDQGFPVPKDGEKLAFAFDAFREGNGYVFHSILSDPKYLVREDLLDTHLVLNAENQGNNIFTLTWNETAGKVYELQGRLAGTEEWLTLATVTDGQTRSYTTDKLGTLVQMEYRVLCPDTVPVLESPITAVQAGGELLYSTIWPIKNLTVYEAADRATAIGTVNGASAHCVLGLEDGMFKIRFADTYGYIDSCYCMINLADYLGDHCLYNITNSYSSLYKAHDYDIPDVTGSLVAGYEQVMVGENEYLVPLLYPAALKMEKAVLTAEKLGYKLLIYDSFRPQSATVALHDLAYAFSQTLVPSDDPEAKPMTFGEYMTDFYRYTLSNFIAKGRSRHNLGVAMDLTLVAIDPTMTPTLPGSEDLPETAELEGEEVIPVIGPDGELIMQTPMHDLTWFSERKQNNLNAQILAYIMEDAGFAGIASEWWHYQDNEAYAAYNPPALYAGVTPEGWITEDGVNWRYRNLFGEYLTDCTEIIEGEMYAFDADGYATWQEYPLEEGEENDQTA